MFSHTVKIALQSCLKKHQTPQPPLFQGISEPFYFALDSKTTVSTCKDKCIEVSSQCFRFINPNIGKHISQCKVVLIITLSLPLQRCGLLIGIKLWHTRSKVMRCSSPSTGVLPENHVLETGYLKEWAVWRTRLVANWECKKQKSRQLLAVSSCKHISLDQVVQYNHP